MYKLSRGKKRAVIVVYDVLAVIFLIWIALSLRTDSFYTFRNEQFAALTIAPFIAVPIFYFFGLYKEVIRYVGFRAIWYIVLAVSLFIFIWGLLVLFVLPGLPRSTPIILWALLIVAIGGSRMLVRWYFTYSNDKNSGSHLVRKTIIYGAGKAGVQLTRALAYVPNVSIIAFVDDDPSVRNTVIEGIPVWSPTSIERLIRDFAINEILLAMPSLSKSRRQQIINNLESHQVLVRSLPGIDELAKGDVTVSDIREIDIGDLLGRSSVQPDISLLHRNIKNKAVLVTGAGGSIGTELCKQIARYQPSKLILIESHEYSLYELDSYLGSLDVEYTSVLTSVTNEKDLRKVISEHQIETIYHAAAYKHVPMVEKNPEAGVLTNTLGTYYLVKASLDTSVETFVLISTDKAVRPSNIMGATKRLAELVLQAYAHATTDICFTMVRFGNVIGSSGSVVPLFRRQIREGGPVTVTHPEVTRFFMSIPEAVELVIQAGAMSHGGEVFVLDMGEPVEINYLAERMIQLSGYTLKSKENDGGDIEIKYTGLRPGEKLYEELLIGENVEQTEHQQIMRANEAYFELPEFEQILKKLELAVEASDTSTIIDILVRNVEGFKPDAYHDKYKM